MHTVLTPSVIKAEEFYYGRTYPTLEETPPLDPLTQQEVDFIHARDSFYLSSITETGWPYIQARGGPAGFLKVTSPHQISFCDYGGNRQMVSVGNISQTNRVALFLIDYPRRHRLKVLAHATVLDAREHPEKVESLLPPSGHGAKPERIFELDIVSYDWNCPKFITPRYTKSEVNQAIEPLQKRIAELEEALKKAKQS